MSLCKGNTGSNKDWQKQHIDLEIFELKILKGGESLYDLFIKDTDQEKSSFKKTARETIEEYLYDANGTLQNKTPLDDCKQFEEKGDATHKACWKQDERGGVGETILHICYLKNTAEHKKIAEILLDICPNLALDIYEEAEYYGESCLHLAIVNNDLESVKKLVEKKAVLNQRAKGKFFRRENQRDGLLLNHAGYVGYAYYGEYPIHFAASLGNIEIYNYLIEEANPSTNDSDGSGNTALDTKADPGAKDSYGNTALHMAVIHDKLDMYKNIMTHETLSPNIFKKRGTEEDKENGPAVMELACEEGRSEIFEAILEDSCNTAWEFGPVKCVTHPLDGLDSIEETGKLDFESALWKTVFGGADGHLDMLESGVIYLLLQEKWKEFAEKRILISFILAFIHLIVFSIAVYLRPDGDLLSGTAVKDMVRYTAEVIVFIDCALYLGFECINIKALKRRYLKLQIYIPAKSIFLVSCILFLLCLPFRLASLRSVEDILTTLAVPMAWSYLLFFFRGREDLGPFVTIIYKMTVGDLLPFSIIWIAIISILCPVFYYPYKNMEGIESFGTAYGSWMYLFHMTFDEFEILISGDDDEIELSRLPAMTKITFVVFMALIPILLMNMLIAKMAQTYQTIEHRAWREWLRQWARIILVVEHSCSRKDLKRYRKAYSASIPKVKYLNCRYKRITIEDRDIERKALCDSLMIVKPSGTVRPYRKYGDSSMLTRLSLKHWKVLPKATRKQLTEQATQGNQTEVNTGKRTGWKKLVEHLPGSAL